MNGNEKTKLKSLKDGTLRDTDTLTTPLIDLSRVRKRAFENIQDVKMKLIGALRRA